MTNMTDRNRITAWMTAIYVSTTSFTVTPGTGGGSAFTITPPFLLALLTANGSNTSNGTEATTVNCPGYTTLAGGSAKSVTWSYSAGVITTTNSQSYSATGSWSTVTGAEIWDSAGTKLRYLQGALTSSITGVANGDTVLFATGAITGDWTQA